MSTPIYYSNTISTISTHANKLQKLDRRG